MLYVLRNVTDLEVFCHQLVYKHGELMDTVLGPGGEVVREEEWAYNGGVTPHMIRKGWLVVEQREEDPKKKNVQKAESKPPVKPVVPEVVSEKKNKKKSSKEA